MGQMHELIRASTYPGEKSMNSYFRFREKLDATFPFPTPATESKVEIEILSKLMTPEEAEIACNLSPQPENAQSIATRVCISVEKIRPVLEDLARKGVLFEIYADDPLYCLVPLMPGIYEFQVGTVTPTFAALFEKYYAEGLKDAMLGLKTPWVRIIPIKESIACQRDVLTYEEVESFIDKAASVALAECICRSSKRLIGEGCDAPDDVCIILDGWADYFVKNHRAKKVTKDEAKIALQRAEDAGLVHETMNIQEGPVAICSCCSCCCAVLRGITDSHIPTGIAKSNFIAEVTKSDCMGCGLCVERCQAKAMEPDDGIVTLLEERCIGCGVCTSVCSTQAISMRRRAQQTTPPKTVNELMGQMAADGR
jgi:electron transport complex protein RnfB